MNWLMEHEAEVLNLTLHLRKFVLQSLLDNDLNLRLQPHTQTLGELLLELAHQDWIA
jgi:7,8-dihydro-6-hydroxymethylpterin-pyrophosphokinase